MHMSKEIVVIILNWNASPETIKLVENICSVEDQDISFIIVDNGSRIEHRKELEEFALERESWKLVREREIESGDSTKGNFLLLLKENYGYSKGNNFGLRLAQKLGFEYSIVANNDVSLDIPVISKMLEIMKTDKSIAIVGPKVVDRFGKTQGPFKRPSLIDEFWKPLLFPIFWAKKVLVSSLNRNMESASHTVFPFAVSGCFFLVRNSSMKNAGNFDENTFLYMEEIILSERLRNQSMKVAYTSEIYINHHHELSTSKISKKEKFEASLSSTLYYYEVYRKFGRFKLFLVKLGRGIMFFFWEEIIRRLNRNH